MTVSVCDDEKNLREYLSRLIKTHSADCLVDLYSSGRELLDAKKEYDIYFLDIQMPGLNGMQTAKCLRERQPGGVIIFITALSEYMQDAFDVQAFHYLVKPVDETKFRSVFAKAAESFRAENERQMLIKNGSTSVKIPVKDISYTESLGKKVIIHTKTGSFEHYGSMKEIESIVGSGFFRCHRCYLVNMDCVVRYNSNTVYLSGGAEIMLARKKYPLFVKAVIEYMRDGAV